MGFDFARIEAAVLEKRGGIPISKTGFAEPKSSFFRYSLVREGRGELAEFEKWKEAETLGERARVCWLEGKRVLARHFNDEEQAAHSFFALHTLRFERGCRDLEEPLALFFPGSGGILVTEFMEGKNLYEAHSSGKLGAKPRDICHAVLLALANLHKSDALHMHPHPKNIIVKDRGRCSLANIAPIVRCVGQSGGLKPAASDEDLALGGSPTLCDRSKQQNVPNMGKVAKCCSEGCAPPQAEAVRLPRTRGLSVNGEQAKLVDPKHIKFQQFSDKNFGDFLREASFFILTVMGGWKKEYSIELLYGPNDAKECMGTYLANCWMTHKSEYAMAIFEDTRYALAVNAGRKPER